MLTISDIAVALSTVVATITLIFFVIQDRRSRRERELREWQTALVYRLFARRYGEQFPIDEILKSYRSEALATEVHALPRRELSEYSLHRIITDMCARKLIEPVGSDTYRLYNTQETPMPSEFTGMINAVSTFLGGEHSPGELLDINRHLKGAFDQELAIYHRAVNLVGDDPNRYSLSDLVLRVAKDLGVDHERVRSKLLSMVRNGNLSEEDGRLSL